MTTWHIVTSEYPPDVGGVSDYTRQVAEGLTRTGDEVHVWCPHAAHACDLPRLHIHPELGRFQPNDLRRLDECLTSFSAPRRLLVQWVPHGFGFHSMNVWFCLWLARRAWLGDNVELIVHEPYLEFRRGRLSHVLIACVHRLMTVIVLAAARKVWLSIPAWEVRLRPYALGRTIPMEWLPVPGCVPGIGAAPEAEIRLKYVAREQLLLGHFGTYGCAIRSLLEERIPALMDGPFRPSLLLIGLGSDRFRDGLLERHPRWSGHVFAAGYVPAADLAAHIAACDVLLQPYPDGMTSRRTSGMACLSQSRPIVTTSGHLTELMWLQTDALAIADVDDVGAFIAASARLLADSRARRRMGMRAGELYRSRFALEQVVTALKAA